MADLKTRIMRRVYVLWFLRQMARPFFVKSVLLALLVWQFALSISVRQILSNWTATGGDAAATYAFVKSAFVNTEFATVLLLLGIGILAALLAGEALLARPGHAKALARI